MLKLTKIVGTTGPASSSKEVLTELVKSGLNVMRVNFSHASHEDALLRINMLNEINEELKTNVAWLCDTKGPEIRLHDIDGGKILLEKGNKINVHMNEVLGNVNDISQTYSQLNKCVEVGGKILIDDGLVELEIISIKSDLIECLILNSGHISNKKGVNVPNAILQMDYLSPKDIGDVEFACTNGASYIAASFVRRKEDVISLKEITKRMNRPDIQIISKIENQEGVDNIDEIIIESHGIMVARGDLGTEIPMEEVPIVQKSLVEKCNSFGKPVIVATQMLESMQKNPRPTRAEVGDVARAVLDGADAVMLSGESANGEYPIESVTTMATIVKRTEQTIDHNVIISRFVGDVNINPYDGVGLSAVELARTINAKAIFCFSEAGNTPRKISKYRPICPIIALSRHEQVIKNLALNWGVHAKLKSGYTTLEDKYDIVKKEAIEMGFTKGDYVIITGGHPDGVPYTNFLKILEID